MGYQWNNQHDLDREHRRLSDQLKASQQSLAESRHQRDAFSQRARQLRNTIDRLWARLADASKPFGTTIEVKGDVAELKLKAAK